MIGTVRPRTLRRSILAAALGLPLVGAAAGRPSPGPVVVFAAVSLAEVLRTLAAAWSADTPALEVRFAFAASSTLARQIAQGAPADLFISADEAWMDDLERRGLIVRATRAPIAGNRLVVVRPGAAGSPAAPTATPEDPDAIEAALGNAGASGRIAVGDPSHVPAGRYAEAALRHLGLWDAVRPRLVRTDSVRTALAYVERSEAMSGIVYATDARISRRVDVAARFPATSHPPIRYPAAVLAGAAPEASRVLALLHAAPARATLGNAGFTEP